MNPKNQSCPYCGHEVDDACAEWEEGRNEVKCDGCKRHYSVAPIYKFEGFLIEEHCERCGLHKDEECECDLESTAQFDDVVKEEAKDESRD